MNRIRSCKTIALWGLLIGLGWSADSLARVDGNTAAGLFGGRFVIQGLGGHASHTHGGPPAQVGGVRVRLQNHTDQAQRVSVTDIEFLTGVKDCDHPPTQVVSHPRFGGLFWEDSDQKESTPQLLIPAGKTATVSVGFASVPAYYVYCDRFAFRVHFKVGKSTIAVVSEVLVTRREPLRHPANQR